MLAKRIIAHFMILLIALPPQAVMADMLTQNTLGTTGQAAGTAADTSTATANAVNPAVAAAQARAAAQDMLTRNTLALQSVQAMQEAARAAAATMNNAGMNPNLPGTMLPDVPNGLGVGGLDLNHIVSGANAPVQSLENARSIVTIQQTQQQAMLEWNTFNVGRQTTVRFDQSNTGAAPASSVAFNRVTDPSGNPTQILGSIESQGQVYVINQNGIIFGGASVVNTGALTVSSLPINDNLVSRGLLSNPDAQFLFSATAQAAGNKGPTPAYTPPAPPSSGRIGDVIVQPGAQITAPTSSANVGGRVALIGPNVKNEGSIYSPDGQTILAAGMQVGFDAHSSDDPSLRGLDVYVGSVGSYGGSATNTGLISAPRGSIIIAGKNVSQNGFVQSSTSVALNGRVDLQAEYNAIANPNYGTPNQGAAFVYTSGNSTGTVSLGAGSVLQILPEYASTTKVVGTELSLKSQINMRGLAIHMASGSVVHAPNANVTLSAGVWDLLIGSGTTQLDFVQSGGQVYLDQDAVIDVSGSTGVAATISQYILTVDLRGAELADVPLQRNGSLRGQSVTVDMRESGTRADGTRWYGTPLANLTGYLGVIERDAGQLTTAGGTVNINAGSSVVLQNGSIIRAAGGYQDFAGGEVTTTRLIDDGNLIEIADADPSVVYDGIYDPSTTTIDPRWGVTTTADGIFAANTRLESAHVFGGAGGSVSISAPAMALDGTLAGGTVTGPQQLSAAPTYSSLTLKWQSQLISRTNPQFPLISPTPPAITFRDTASTLPAAAAFALDGSGAPLALRSERLAAVDLSPTLLTTQGFGSLAVHNGDGNISVPAGVNLNVRAAGSITLRGANVDVQGGIIAPSGRIDLTAYNISPFTSSILLENGSTVMPAPNAGRGIISVGSAARLSTVGLIINDRADAPAPLTVPHSVTGAGSTLDGGTISLDGYSIDLLTGSMLDVTGGLVAGKGITYGDAGTISLHAGRDPILKSLLGGHLALGGTLRGLSGAEGGSLDLLAPVIQIGGTTTNPNTLLLEPEFFSQGGFSHFKMTGLGSDTVQPAVIITPGVQIMPQVRSLLADVSLTNGLSSLLLSELLQPEGYRNTAHLDFEAPGVKDSLTQLIRTIGRIQMGAGSRILTDALGSVTMHGQVIDLLGEITTPGGSVDIQGADHYPEDSPSAFAIATVHVGSTARVSTAGKTVYLNDIYNNRRGHVYAGGSIIVSGNTVADAGSLFDVSGTSAIIDLLPQEAGLTLDSLNAVSLLTLPANTIPTLVTSNGGSLTWKGAEFLLPRSTMVGLAGGAGAQGGVLSVSSGRFVPVGNARDDKETSLTVAQSLAGLSAATLDRGWFAADSFLSGGFDSLRLAGNVDFRNAVDITARGYLSIADGGVIRADALTRLTAAYVTLGRTLTRPTRDEELVNPFQVNDSAGSRPSYFSPTGGAGRLEVIADQIDAGTLSLQNISSAALTARQELRGSGFLDIAGSLAITAGQIVPLTASNFTITAYGTGSSVSIYSSGTNPAFPLSAGGRLNIYAQTISQHGVLRAPFGSIQLGWDGTGTAPKGLITNTSVPIAQQITLGAGSTTSVSAIDPRTGTGVTIPYGIVKDGTNWIDPTGLDITATGVPEKTLRVSAQNITTEAGSTLDLRGGGTLYGYRWIQGNGGSADILDTQTSFALLPGYVSQFAPYAPFAASGIYASNLGGDLGYQNTALNAGDRVYLKDNALLAAGNYTLLPARYALLPGALLVTPLQDAPVDSLVKPGGAVLASGYRFNSLNPTAGGQVYSLFEIAPQNVIRVRSEYADYSAQTHIRSEQQRLSLPITRGPLDAGYTLLSAQQSMQLAGAVSAAGAAGGRGGRVDISSPLDILITTPGAPAQSGKLVLDAALLSAWNAESLLIGGERDSTGRVTVRTTNLTLDNAGTPLTGTDIVLAATQTLTLAPNSVLTQVGTQNAADALVINGNGALVRVSGVENALTSRIGVTPSTLPQLIIGAGAVLSGETVTLDSSNITTLSPDALLNAGSLQLSSGRISVLLDNPGTLQPQPGMILGGALLTGLQAADSLSLLSYSSIDLYGTGALNFAGDLELHAGQIRGLNQSIGQVAITAKNLVLDNSSLGTTSGIVAPSSGLLSLNAETITLGENALVIDQYAAVALNATRGMTLRDSGSLRAQNDLQITTPFVRTESNAIQSIAANGALSLLRGSAAVTPATPGLGSQLSLQGASVSVATDVLLPSGLISVQALTGDVTVNGRLDAGGIARTFFDATRFTNAGQITLQADAGNVNVGSTGVLNLAASAGGGNAGLLVVNAAQQLEIAGSLLGSGVKTGSVEVDVGTLASFEELNNRLNAGSFTESRDLRVRSGNVSIDGVVNAKSFILALDAGSITVNGTINAAGSTGGRINLISNGNLTLNNGSVLSVRGTDFDSAGKGGSIWLETTGTGRLNVAGGSTLNLSVDAQTASSATRGQFGGKLHLRAPQNASFNDLLIDPLAGSVLGASSIEIEGFRSYLFNQSNVLLRAGTLAIAGEHLTTTTIHSNNTSFMANHAAITTRLLGGNPALQSISVLQPGVEIVNRGGSISLGTATSAAVNDWNLASFRYGPQNAAGTLTMRAVGNLEFYNALSDGFTPTTTGTTPLVERLWLAPLSALNTNAPVTSQNWNLRLTAGADVNAANSRETASTSSLAANTGSLLLGKDAGQAVPTSNAPGTAALTRLAINPTNNTATTGTPTASNRFQVIRTGTGDIEINAGRDVQFLNQFATIYTAGVTVPVATTIFTAGDFVLPNVSASVPQNELGAVQQLHTPQFSMAGGNVSVKAGADILHLTKDNGLLVADSSRQLPNNWLMRRGYVNPAGEYGLINVRQSGVQQINDVAASTAWWVNFTNFFDGVAALGGGNVVLKAGRDVQNVSAHAATNARAARGTPSAAGVLELGGGDVSVTTGRNIDGGIYYVERGSGTLTAGGEITTNATRSLSLGRLSSSLSVQSQDTWLPTTLFAGKSQFTVTAREDVLLGPVANTFLLPQGLTNRHWYKTYFSTYAENSGVNVTSLGGDVSIRQAATLSTNSVESSLLAQWNSEMLLLGTGSSSAAAYQPWLRLAETDVSAFQTVSTLMPGTLKATAFSGDIQLTGRMNLSPSATGTLELLAAGGVHGLTPTGVSSSIINGKQTTVWASATVNLSDANPASIPGVLAPFAFYQTYFNPAAPTAVNNLAARISTSTFLDSINAVFDESGSTSGDYATTQTKQQLHASGVLHAADTSPVRIYAGDGDVSGLSLFSGKAANILAQQDITDISFYIQNVRDSDLSLISSGRDIIAYNASSALRTQAVTDGNLPSFTERPKSGDIQISGPGALQVLSGRNLDLGTGSNNSDGTGVGITSIGNGRNPYLPFAGADIILSAGLGATSQGLGGSGLNFDGLVTQFSTPRNLASLAELLGVPSVNINDPALTAEQQKQLSLALFYVALRNAGRDRNDPNSPDAGTYAAGELAIDTLIPGALDGNILTQARDIRTRSGGDISILAPGGSLQLASTLIGETLAPPGIITEAGGNISVFAQDDVSIGIARIFTLRGGDITIWSSEGDIAAGSSAKTVQSAPPTRVLIDPQSASVATDLAGLATGGGIGVLATVAGVRPGNVDLIAPVGAVDAGDAGIRATGNLNIAAALVLNAGNISVGGTSAGAPSAPSVATPSLGGLASAASATAATNSSPATQQAAQQQDDTENKDTAPSIITVEVLGYGGGDGNEDEDERKRRSSGAE